MKLREITGTKQSGNLKTTTLNLLKLNKKQLQIWKRDMRRMKRLMSEVTKRMVDIRKMAMKTEKETFLQQNLKRYNPSSVDVSPVNTRWPHSQDDVTGEGPAGLGQVVTELETGIPYLPYYGKC